MVPPGVISGRRTGAGLALGAFVCTEAWVVNTAAATTGGMSAAVAKSQPTIGHRTAIRRVGVKWRGWRNGCSGVSNLLCYSNKGYEVISCLHRE